ncbi:MAG: VWA domain-containing protein, partial [Candidatus Dormibacteraceae bacterium]
MAFDVTRPLLLGVGALALGAVFLTWWRWAPPLSRGRARLSLGVRVLIVLLLTAALSGLEFQTTPSAQSVVVAADLSASTQTAVDVEAATVRQILSRLPSGDMAGVLSFGRDPQVELNVSSNPQFAQFQSQPNPNYTDLASAMQLAGSILPTDSRRHVVVVSDGRSNLGDPVAEARLLRAEGVRVDTVALNVPVGSEAYVDRVEAPGTLNQGQEAAVQALIVSNTATPATVRWYLDKALLSSATVQLANGETAISQTVKPVETGFHTLRIAIDPVRDTYSENNLGEALIQVVGPPRVLLVEQAAGDAASLEAALLSTGILATTITPDQLPRTAADLAAYQSVVLVNIPAGSLGTAGMALLRAATRDLGAGLVVLGGSDSYGPGGYAGTALEAALPVQMLLPQTMQKPPVAVMLVLESTESGGGDQVLRGAAEAVVDGLTARDMVGVTNGTGSVVIPLTTLTDKAKVKSAIEAMGLGDPISYVPDLNSAAQQLSKAKAALKHIILLGDGDARDNYEPVITSIHNKGITVSTVAAGTFGTDPVLMQEIATWGHGRFYQSNGVNDVPQIFLKETNEALKPWIVEGSIIPHLSSLIEALPGVPLNTFPALTGYVATTPRAAADIVLTSPQGDPLLATWEYGLGRVMAWTSDAQGQWTADLLRWPSANRFLGDIVRYSLPQSSDPALQVETQSRADHTHLLVTAPASSGSKVEVSAVAPDLSGVALTLSSTGPGRYEGDLPTDQVGSYLLHITQSAGGATKHATTYGLVVPYSPEYRDLGTDLNTLREIANAGGGTLITDLARVYTVPVPPVQAAQSLDELLLVLAVLLFPIDVALRRLAMRAEDVPVWRAAFKRAPAAPIAAEATVTRLKERVSDVRSARATKPPPDAAPPAAEKPAPGKTIEQLRSRLRLSQADEKPSRASAHEVI